MSDPKSVTCNKAGIDLIKESEGLKLTAYQCQAMVWTIGYGHTASNVYDGKTITEQTANKLLKSDIDDIELKLKSMIKTSVTENQWSAIVCLIFNVGIPAFRNSRLLKCINAKQDNCIKEEWITWCFYTDYWSGKKKQSNGLKIRRQKEYELFCKA
jgi:lysozyme